MSYYGGMDTAQFHTKVSSPFRGEGVVTFTPNGMDYSIKTSLSTPVRILLTAVIGSLIIVGLFFLGLFYIGMCFFVLIYYAVGYLFSWSKNGNIPYSKITNIVFDIVSLRFNYTEQSGEGKFFVMSIYPPDVNKMQWVLGTKFSADPVKQPPPAPIYGPPPPQYNYPPPPVYAPPPPPVYQQSAQGQNDICPRCRRPMSYDPMSGKWVCKHCAQYR